LTGRWARLAARALAKAMGAILVYLGLTVIAGATSVPNAVGEVVPALTVFVGGLLVLSGIVAILS